MTDKPPEPVLHAKPSRDPANDATLTGMLNQVLKKNLQSIDDCMPAVVIAYDRASNRATVQPMIKILATNGETLSRAQIASVTVFQLAGGGMMLNFNLKAGDLGWIKATDRDLSLYLQAQNEQHPNTGRMHSFNDGFFMPQLMGSFTLDGEDAENAVLSTVDGTVRIAIWPDRVKITAPRTVVESPIVEVIAPTSVDITTPLLTLDGDMKITGKLDVDGNIVSGQTITGTVNVKAGTKLLKAHTHGTGTPTTATTLVNN